MLSSGESGTCASVMADAAVQCQLYSDTPLCPPSCVVSPKQWQWYYSLLMNYDTWNVFSISEDYHTVRGTDPQQDSDRLVFCGFDDGLIPYRGLELIIILGLGASSSKCQYLNLHLPSARTQRLERD